MGKLQRIEKPNDRFIYLVYPPVETIQLLNWDKGDEITFSIEDGKMIIEKVS